MLYPGLILNHLSMKIEWWKPAWLINTHTLYYPTEQTSGSFEKQQMEF